MFCEPKLNEGNFADYEAQQVLGEDWTHILRKLDTLELGRRAQSVEHVQGVDGLQDAGDHSVLFRATSTVHLQPSPAVSQVESPLATYTNRRYECGA